MDKLEKAQRATRTVKGLKGYGGFLATRCSPERDCMALMHKVSLAYTSPLYSQLVQIYVAW